MMTSCGTDFSDVTQFSSPENGFIYYFREKLEIKEERETRLKVPELVERGESLG